MHDVLKSRPTSYWVTVLAVVTVAFVAAVISYSHITDIALAAGEDWRSYLIPWTFDGVVLAASMTMMIRRARGLAYGWLPISALGFGVLGSIAANVANAVTRHQTIMGNHDIAIMLAGFVPLAFLACFHMLLGQHALVTIRPDVELSPSSPEVGEHVRQADLSQVSLGQPDVVGAPEGKEVAKHAGSEVDRTPHTPQVSGWPWPVAVGSGPGKTVVTTDLGSGPEFSSLPHWQVWRADLTGSLGTGFGKSVGQPKPELDLPGGNTSGNGARNGTAVLSPGLPPLTELEGGRGQSNGHSSPSSSASTSPGTGESKSIEITTSSPSVRQDTTPGTPVISDSDTSGSGSSAIPEDVSRYLKDELYALAAADGLTLEQLLWQSRKPTGLTPRSLANGVQRPSPGDRPETAESPRSPAEPATDPGEGASPEVNPAAHPTPTTPPPVLPSQRQPEQVSGTEHPASGTQPLTTDQILAYLDRHQGITVRRAATDLGVSESTVYRAKRTRTQAGSGS